MKRKLLSLLVLLMTAATGAWAQGVDYDIDVNFDPYYNPDFTQFNCMIMNPMEPWAEIKGTLNLSVDGVSKGSFEVNSEMVDGSIAALDAGDHTWSAVFYPEGGGSFSNSRNFTINKVNTSISYYGSTSINMGVGESTELDVYMNPTEAYGLSYSSSDASVASITKKEYSYDTYIIQAKAAGTATITFSFAGSTNYKAADNKTITVTVEPAVVASGNCGTSGHESEVTWTLTSDGVLTISGTGAMADYTDANYQPWASIRSDIKTIVIEDGVTSIGNYAFSNCEYVTSDVSIPASVTSIGNYSFNYCTMTSLTIPSNSSLETIGSFAFNCAVFGSVTIPASVKSIGNNAFDACTNLTTVTLNSNPTIGTGAFGSAAVTMNLTANGPVDGAYWTTFYNENYGFTADVSTTIYKATVNGAKTAVVLTEVDDIPAGNAAVLKSSNAAITMTLTTSASGDYTGNELLGADAAMDAPANAYCLTGYGGTLGFYTYTGTIPVNKAYLVVPSSARSFYGFGDNYTTDIDLPEAVVIEGDGPIYDLSGRQVTGQPQKGIYVKNGKKVVIK